MDDRIKLNTGDNQVSVVVWIPTADAAVMIGCLPRNVRILCGQGRLVSRKGAKRGRGHDLEVTQASVEVWAKRKGKGRPRSVLDGFIVRR